MKVRLWMLLMVGILLVSACAGNVGNNNITPAVTPSSGPLIEEVPAPTNVEGRSQPADDAPVSPAGEAEVIAAPVLAGTLLGYEVSGPNGEVGDVTGIVADMLNGQVQYVSLVTVGSEPERSVLLPWGTFQVVVFPMGDNQSGVEPAPQMWLDAAADVAGAPQFDPNALDTPTDLTADWAAEASAYWSERVEGLPATGVEDNTDGLMYLRDERFNQMEFPLVDTQGEELGEIEDMVIGEGGVMTLAILDPRGELAEGRDLVVVGWKAMSWIPEEGRFVLNVPAERLNDAPNFSPSDLPDTTLPGWDADWMEYWQGATAPEDSTVATPTEEGARLPVNAGVLLDQPVEDREGNELGLLVDWWMNIQGQSEYAILQEEARLVLLPWMALDWDSNLETMVLNIDPNLLADAPSFPNATDMDSDTNWHAAADQYWQEFMQVAGDDTSAAPGAVREDVRIKRIINGPVFGPAGENLGEVADMIFSPEGRVTYIAVRANNSVKLVPWMNFEYSLKDAQLKYLDDELRLSEAPTTDLGSLNLSAADWDADLRTYWGMK